MIDRAVQGAAARAQGDAVLRVCYDGVGDVQYRVGRRRCDDAISVNPSILQLSMVSIAPELN